MFQIPNLELM